MRFMNAWMLCLVTLGVAAVHAADDDVPKKVEKHIGSDTVDLLQEAARVEVFRIKPEQGAKSEEGISGYPITAAGKEQGKPFAARLATVLLQEKTYFGDQALCFTPGVAFRIWRPKDKIQ